MTDPTPPTVPVPAAPAPQPGPPGPPVAPEPEPGPPAAPAQPTAQRAAAEPPIRRDPPPGGPTDPADRTVSPIAHPPVTLPPNPPADATDADQVAPIHDPAAPIPARKPGLREIIIGVLGVVALVSAFLPWQHLPGANAWPIGMWVAPVLGVLGAAAHLIRFLPPADKAFGALLPLMLATGAVWVPVAHLYGNVRTAGTWVCLAAGVLLVGALLAAAMTDPALRSADNPDDVFD